MKVIFLDVDGVLNSPKSKTYAPSGWRGIDNAKLKKVKAIVDATDAKVVLSSTWKTEIDKNMHHASSDGKYMMNKFKYEGRFKIFDKTPDAENSSHRGEEIRMWLDKHPDVDNFVILDDIDFDDMERFGVLDHLIMTDYNIGITDEDVEKAIEKLGRKE